MATLALIGLGSNLGDREAILAGAVAAMDGTPGIEVRAVSSFHETAPVGGPPGQGPFLNAASLIETRSTRGPCSPPARRSKPKPEGPARCDGVPARWTWTSCSSAI